MDTSSGEPAVDIPVTIKMTRVVAMFSVVDCSCPGGVHHHDWSVIGWSRLMPTAESGKRVYSREVRGHGTVSECSSIVVTVQLLL
jgi:hypothetical protein